MNNFWRSLDSNPLGRGVAAVWRMSLGLDFDPTRMALLEAAAQPAESYPCRHGCGCSHRVVRHGPDDLVAVCQCEEWDCDDFPLKPDDVVSWELSLPRLARHLARALELDPKRPDLGVWGTTPLGTWSPDGIPVLLLVPHTRDHFRKAVAGLSALLKERFIVFAPTCHHFDVAVRQLLVAGQGEFFPLETTVAVGDRGEFWPLKRPGELFAPWAGHPKVVIGDTAREAFAMVRSLDAERPQREASLLTVFRLYCIEEHSAEGVARQCGCSKATVINRLRAIRERTGVDPDQLRTFSAQFQQLDDGLSDSRARRIHRSAALDMPEEVDEETG